MTEDELTAVIAGLKHMKARELRKHFASYLEGTDRCVRSEPLRIEIAHRIQEEFYGLSLPEDDSRRLEEYAQGDCLLVGKKRHHLMAGTVLMDGGRERIMLLSFVVGKRLSMKGSSICR